MFALPIKVNKTSTFTLLPKLNTHAQFLYVSAGIKWYVKGNENRINFRQQFEGIFFSLSSHFFLEKLISSSWLRKMLKPHLIEAKYASWSKVASKLWNCTNYGIQRHLWDIALILQVKILKFYVFSFVRCNHAVCKILYLIIIGSDVWLGWTNTHTVEPVSEVEPLIRLGDRLWEVVAYERRTARAGIFKST